jgi:hypothetical protein
LAEFRKIMAFTLIFASLLLTIQYSISESKAVSDQDQIVTFCSHS